MSAKYAETYHEHPAERRFNRAMLDDHERTHHKKDADPAPCLPLFTRECVPLDYRNSNEVSVADLTDELLRRGWPPDRWLANTPVNKLLAELGRRVATG